MQSSKTGPKDELSHHESSLIVVNRAHWEADCTIH